MSAHFATLPAAPARRTRGGAMGWRGVWQRLRRALLAQGERRAQAALRRIAVIRIDGGPLPTRAWVDGPDTTHRTPN